MIGDIRVRCTIAEQAQHSDYSPFDEEETDRAILFLTEKIHCLAESIMLISYEKVTWPLPRKIKETSYILEGYQFIFEALDLQYCVHSSRKRYVIPQDYQQQHETTYTLHIKERKKWIIEVPHTFQYLPPCNIL